MAERKRKIKINMRRGLKKADINGRDWKKLQKMDGEESQRCWNGLSSVDIVLQEITRKKKWLIISTCIVYVYLFQSLVWEGEVAWVFWSDKVSVDVWVEWLLKGESDPSIAAQQ